jgi:hypothetical protein
MKKAVAAAVLVACTGLLAMTWAPRPTGSRAIKAQYASGDSLEVAGWVGNLERRIHGAALLRGDSRQLTHGLARWTLSDRLGMRIVIRRVMQHQTDSITAVCDFLGTAGVFLHREELNFRRSSGSIILVSPDWLRDTVLLNESAGTATQEAVSPRYSQHALIPAVHPGTPQGTYVIRRELTRDHLGVSLFGEGTEMHLDAILTDADGWEVAFVADREWGRIVYGWQRPDDQFLKSYGDNLGEYRFQELGGMAIDAADTVFVSDSWGKKIVRLFYDRGARLLRYAGELPLPMLGVVGDLAYDQGASVGYVDAEDGLWVADPEGRRVIKVKKNGAVDKIITQVGWPGYAWTLDAPIEVASPPFSPLLAIYDRRAWPQGGWLLTVDKSSIMNGSAQIVNRTEFDPQHPAITSLGADYFGQLWGGDVHLNCYHLFDTQGAYLASYQPPPNVIPVAFSRISPRLFGQAPVSVVSFASADRWSDATGLRTGCLVPMSFGNRGSLTRRLPQRHT